jgi:hypothetical protein
LKSKAYEDRVSRAYYAAFHATQALLFTEGLSADTHHGVVTLFGLHFVKTEKFDRRYLTHLITLHFFPNKLSFVEYCNVLSTRG